ncbi:MAG: hypothetical protein IJM37_01800 [Lachnospiraceae bacterium]|nr:hypothetical protein [Lachnospiraceae bacterium]
MRRQKNKFLNFILSCLPGAGHMYLGFVKQGISIMTLFFAIIAIAGWMRLDIMLFVLPVLWFYSFFDSLNKNSMPQEEFVRLDDDYLWSDYMEKGLVKKSGNGKVAAVVLIVLGAVILIKNILKFAEEYLFELFGNGIYYWMDNFYQIIFAVLIIVIGIRLIAGKKKALDSKEADL